MAGVFNGLKVAVKAAFEARRNKELCEANYNAIQSLVSEAERLYREVAALNPAALVAKGMDLLRDAQRQCVVALHSVKDAREISGELAAALAFVEKAATSEERARENCASLNIAASSLEGTSLLVSRHLGGASEAIRVVRDSARVVAEPHELYSARVAARSAVSTEKLALAKEAFEALKLSCSSALSENAKVCEGFKELQRLSAQVKLFYDLAYCNVVEARKLVLRAEREARKLVLRAEREAIKLAERSAREAIECAERAERAQREAIKNIERDSLLLERAVKAARASYDATCVSAAHVHANAEKTHAMTAELFAASTELRAIAEKNIACLHVNSNLCGQYEQYISDILQAEQRAASEAREAELLVESVDTQVNIAHSAAEEALNLASESAASIASTEDGCSIANAVSTLRISAEKKACLAREAATAANLNASNSALHVVKLNYKFSSIYEYPDWLLIEKSIFKAIECKEDTKCAVCLEQFNVLFSCATLKHGVCFECLMHQERSCSVCRTSLCRVNSAGKISMNMVAFVSPENYRKFIILKTWDIGLVTNITVWDEKPAIFDEDTNNTKCHSCKRNNFMYLYSCSPICEFMLCHECYRIHDKCPSASCGRSLYSFNTNFKRLYAHKLVSERRMILNSFETSMKGSTSSKTEIYERWRREEEARLAEEALLAEEKRLVERAKLFRLAEAARKSTRERVSEAESRALQESTGAQAHRCERLRDLRDLRLAALKRRAPSADDAGALS